MVGARDRRLPSGFILLLIPLTFAAAAQQSQDDKPPAYTVASTDPEGARALLLWLSTLGYRADAQPPAVFRVPAGVAVALLLEPSQGVSPAEWEILDSWVENGGTLILAGSGFTSSTAFLHYGFRPASLGESQTLSAQGPLLRSPAATELPVAPAPAYLSSTQADYLPILAAGDRPVVVLLQSGKGQVLLSSTAYPFTNAGLKQAGNASLVLSLISSAPAAGTVWFDEWHHGIRASQPSIVGPGNWLRYTPSGRSIAYTVAVVFIALVSRGQRFGRPEPLPGPASRRGPLDHINAIANLSPRARHRQTVLERYHHELKRSIGQRFRLDPLLPDEDYARLLSLMEPRLDAERLSGLLKQLRKSDVSERELVQLAAAASRWPRGG